MANPATNIGHQLLLQRPDLVHRAWIPTLVRRVELLLCRRSRIVVMIMLLVVNLCIDSIAVSLFSNPNYSETSKLVYLCKVKHIFVKKLLFSTTKICQPTSHQPWGEFERIQEDLWYRQSLMGPLANSVLTISTLLAPQSGALRISAYRDFQSHSHTHTHPIHL